LLGSGLNTSASVTINVGVKKNASFRQFDSALADLKNNLRAVSTSLGMDKPLTQAVQAAAKNARAISAAQVKQQATTSKKMLDAHVREFGAIERQKAASLRRQTALTRSNLDAHVRDFRASERQKSAVLRQQEREQKALNARMARDAVKNARMMAQQRAMGINQTTALGMRKELLDRIGSATRTGRGSYLDERGREVSFRGIDKNRLAENISGLRSWISQLEKGTMTTKEMAQATKLLNAAFQKADTHQKRMQNDMGYRLDQLEKSLDAIFRAGFRLQMVGSDLMHIGRRIKDGIADIMNTFGEFQFTMNRAAATMDMFDSTATGMTVGVGDLQEAIIGLSAESKIFPAAEVAEALYHWAAATGQTIKTTQDLTDNVTALEPIMKAAAMTATSYETTIKGVYGILSQFYSGDITQATHVTQQLFYMTQKTANEFSDLINAFKMVGPVAAQNNTTFEETARIFGLLADLGIKGTMAGRALRQMFIQASRPSGPAMEALSEIFGDKNQYKKAMNPNGAFVGAEGYVMELAKRMQGMDPSSMMRIVRSITTANELPMLMALIVRAQGRLADGYDTLIGSSEKYMSSLEKEQKYFEDNWKAMTETWNAVAGSVQRTWEHLQIQLGSAMAEVLTPLMETIRDIIERIRMWAKANPGFIKQLTQFASVAAVVAGGLGVVATTLGTLITLFAGFALVLGEAAPFLGKLAAGLGSFSLIVLGVIRNIDYISQSFDYLQEQIRMASDTTNEFGDVFDDVFQTFVRVSDVMGKGIGNLLRGIGDLITHLDRMGNLKPIMEFFVGFLMTMVSVRVIRGLAQLAKGFIGIGKSLIGLQAMSGPLGWITAAVSLIGGLAAVEMLPVGDILGEFTGGLSDLNEEIRGLSQTIDGLNPSGSGSMLSIIQDALFGDPASLTSNDVHFKAIARMTSEWGKGPQQILEDINNKTREAFERTNTSMGWFGREPLTIPNPITSIFETAEFQSIESGLKTDIVNQIMKDIVDLRSMVNERLVLSGTEAFSDEQYAAIVGSIVPDFSNANLNQFAPELWGDALEFIMLGIEREGLSLPARNRISKAFVERFGTDFIQGGIGGALDQIARSGVGTEVVIQQAHKAANTIYNDTLAAANDMLTGFEENGQVPADIQKKVMDLLFAPVAGGDSLFKYATSGKATISPQIREQFSAIMSLISDDVVDEATASGTDMAKDVWKAFVEAVSDPKAMRGAIVGQMKKGKDKERLYGMIGDFFSLDGKNARAFFRSFISQRGNTGLKNMIDATMGQIMTAVDSFMKLRPNADNDAILKFIRNQVPSVNQLRKLGFNRREARRIRAAMLRELKPITDFLKDPLGEAMESVATETSTVSKKAADAQNKLSDARGDYMQKLKERKSKSGGVQVPSIFDPLIEGAKGAAAAGLKAAQSIEGNVESAGTAITRFKSRVISQSAAIRASLIRNISTAAGKVTVAFNNMSENAYPKGYNVGKSWGDGIQGGVSDSGVHATLGFIRALMFGESPPKIGPLRDIDKGGYNIGVAWGDSLGRGARDSMNKRLMDTKREMYRANLKPEANVTYKASSERKLRVEVDIKSSDGTANRKTQAEIRRGAMEALSLSEVSHLISIT
jgi:TP901 family phage tail tape measure protein